MQSPDDERQEKAQDYAKIRRRLTFLDIGLGACFLFLLLFTPLSAGLRDLLDFPYLTRVALYIAVVMVGYGILMAPIELYRGFVLPRRFGLSTQSLRGWLWDAIKGGVLSFVVGVGFVVLIYWLLASRPELWWLMTAAFLLFFSVAMANLFPMIILPLFYKVEPVADAQLAQRLLSLAERAGTRVRGVFTINLSSKATTGNAALMGLGNTRRIVLGDTILDRYSAPEIEVIMAHELGHHVHRDMGKLIVFESVVTLLGFYLAGLVLKAAVTPLGFSGVADVAAFPLLALVLGCFAMAVEPLLNVYSRRLEGAADEYALALTDDSESFSAVMTKLCDQNLSVARPSLWVELFFYDHPPYFRRVERARRYEERRREGAE